MVSIATKGNKLKMTLIWWFGLYVQHTQNQVNLRLLRFFEGYRELVLISCLDRANVRAFHENPNRIHTELTFISP